MTLLINVAISPGQTMNGLVIHFIDVNSNLPDCILRSGPVQQELLKPSSILAVLESEMRLPVAAQ